MIINTSQKGAVYELIASAYLIEQGYEVFRNVAPSGPADLVAWKPETGETLFVDVKSTTKYIKADGSIRYSFDRQKTVSGISYLLMHDKEIVGWTTKEDRGELVEPFSLSIE